MAADKEIMRAIERLRLDRPGRTHRVHAGDGLISALCELAATYREEAELWSRSGAKGWKSSEAEKYLVAQHIDDVAAQLDNAGGGAALSVSEPERKTAHEWNDDPRVDPFVVSWSDFGNSAHEQGLGIDRDALITLAEFEKARDGGAVTVGRRPAATTHERLDDFVASAVAAGKGTLRDAPKATRDDVTAYLKGDVDTLPGLAEALVPGSVADATAPPYCRTCDLDQHRCPGCGEPTDHAESACAACNKLYATAPPEEIAALRPGDSAIMSIDGMPTVVTAMPDTWESDTLTADGHVKPGVAQALAPTLAPTLGQPGDMGTGYSHAYVPAGGRQVTFTELLTPVPAASLPPHLSHSQGNTIGDCATKYRLQRVEALPQIPQWANIGGTAFHAAVEAFERTVGGMPTERAQRANWEGYDCELVWKHHFEATITAVAMTTPVPQSVWRAARKGAEGEQWWRVNGPLMLRRYLDARPDEHTWSASIGPGSPSMEPAIELEKIVEVPTPYGPLPYKAVLDRVTVQPFQGAESTHAALVIRDYKTSYERPTDTTQLGEYAHVLVLAGHVPAGVKILGTYFDARRGEWTTPVAVLAAHPFEAFQYRVTTAHAQKLALTTGPTPARPSSYCGGCAVRYACPIMAAKP